MADLTYDQRRAVEHAIAMFVSQHLFDKPLIFSKLAMALDRAIADDDGMMPVVNGGCGGTASVDGFGNLIQGGGGSVGPMSYAPMKAEWSAKDGTSGSATSRGTLTLGENSPEREGEA